MICETTNPYLNKIRQKQAEKIRTSQVQKNDLDFFDNFVCTDTIDCELIKDIKRSFECTFIPDTVFKFITNKYFVGIKCMVIKNRDPDFEYEHPQYHLEWDQLYSESKGDFHVIYLLYNPIYGKIITLNPKDNSWKEIASEIVLNQSNRKHINTCYHTFKHLYLSKFANY